MSDDNYSLNPPPDQYRPYSLSYYVRATAQLGLMVAVLMLCTDVGFAQAEQYTLQSTANMAAILGAHELPNRDNAVQVATTFMRSNGVYNAESQVTVVGSDLVAVNLNENYQTIFARWLGVDRVPLRATAQEQRM